MLMNGTDNPNITIMVDIVEGSAISILYAVPVLIAVLSLLGNSLIVAAYFKYRNLRDSTTFFIINLGFTDLITGFVLFVVLALNVTNMPQINSSACFVAFRTPTYLTIVSQSLILVTTFERYIGICRRENYSNIMTKRMKISLILVAWLLPLPLSLAPFFGYNYWEEVGCRFPQAVPKWLLLSRSSLIFVQTAITMTLYCRILMKAREIHQKICPASLQGINARTARNKGIKRSIRNGKITGLVTVVFFATWLPYHMILLCYSLWDVELHFGIVHVTKLLGLSNSIMNPFLYAWQRKDIRSRLKEMLRCNGGMQILNQGAVSHELRMKNAMNMQNLRVSSEKRKIPQQSTGETSSYKIRSSDIAQSTFSKSDTSSLVQVTEL